MTIGDTDVSTALLRMPHLKADTRRNAILESGIKVQNWNKTKVDDDDVEELVEDQGKELSTEELLELHKEEKSEKLKPELNLRSQGRRRTRRKVKIIPAKDPGRCCFAGANCPSLLEDYHPDVGLCKRPSVCSMTML
ncbi:hypothetical protein Hamer_G005749 [Homarus americanus]|uniref:Uncharacterized protein n=1 Tax=Homarus americanus TaxID=6706 RepID=A0A8J5JJZ4_HOMAM|nr:hypothetical protein Hamer_G005749 [Homarus americanus]